MLKNLSSILLALVVLMACSREQAPPAPNAPVAPERGGADGGGGDLQQSSAGEVRSAVNFVMRSSVPKALYNLSLGRDNIRDLYLQKIFEKFFTPGARQPASDPVMKDWEASPYFFKETGGCEDGSGFAHVAGSGIALGFV